jgi:GNAT superfamily N-acetyltransferase
MSGLVIRDMTRDDKTECGRILFEAFLDIADRHSFPPDFKSLQEAIGLVEYNQSRTYGVVAERDGRLLGSNFLAEADPVAAVGPISVDPTIQESGVGRALMQAVIERGRNAHAVRLVQDAFNPTSMALYASLGFDVRDPLVLLEGVPKNAGRPADGIEVRRLASDDLEACAAVCRKIHGITRTGELRSGLRGFRGYVALREGRVTAYASTLNLWFAAHAAAESQSDMRALILGAAGLEQEPLSFLLPTRQAELFRFLLAEGLRITKPMTLMTLGPYQEPLGSYMPSVGY